MPVPFHDCGNGEPAGSGPVSASRPVVLLGLGYTTRRLARRLLLRGRRVFAVTRSPERFGELASMGLSISDVLQPKCPAGAAVVHTIPPAPPDETAAIRRVIAGLAPSRLIYISATSVYGEQKYVTSCTLVQESDEKARRRMEEETWLSAGEWKTLIIRPAAIYGPGRGVHLRLREGRLPRGKGMVSRIHVDDLGAILEAGIDSDLTGAWPLADDLPCSSEEISQWCAQIMGLARGEESSFPVAGRDVDGSAIRGLLGVRLAYPTYHAGILASLAEEASCSQAE